MKIMSVNTLSRKFLMFDHSDFDDIVSSISNAESVPDGDFSSFRDLFEQFSNNLVMSDFESNEGRARFMMTSLNTMFGNDYQLDVDRVSDVIMSMATHLSIAVSFIGDKESYRSYLMDNPLDGLN